MKWVVLIWSMRNLLLINSMVSKSKFRFYLGFFSDINDVALANSHFFYTKVEKNLSLLDFKMIIANWLIGRYTWADTVTRKGVFPYPGQVNESLWNYLRPWIYQVIYLLFWKQQSAASITGRRVRKIKYFVWNLWSQV